MVFSRKDVSITSTDFFFETRAKISDFETPPASSNISLASSAEAVANSLASSSVSFWIFLVFPISFLISFSVKVVCSLSNALASFSVISPLVNCSRMSTISLCELPSLMALAIFLTSAFKSFFFRFLRIFLVNSFNSFLAFCTTFFSLSNTFFSATSATALSSNTPIVLLYSFTSASFSATSASVRGRISSRSATKF